MSIALHWYLPTHGDGRTLVQAGAATMPPRLRARGATGRPATLEYLSQVALAAEQSGFDAVLTPTGTWCDDAWITTAALLSVVDRLRFLVAFRSGSISPTLAAQQAMTFQRHSGERLLLNIVTGGEDEEQRRYGDGLSKDQRYGRTDEFLTILRGAWSGEPFDYQGEHLWAEGALAPGEERAPEIYFGGSSDAALRVAARHADVYLTWGEPPPALAAHLERVRALADAQERDVRFGVRLHVIARDTAEEAWAAADALLADADEQAIAAVQDRLTQASAVGQQRMAALHGGRRDRLEIYPNLWAGVGLLRGGAGPRWSAATSRSPTSCRTSCRSTTSLASRSSSSPGTRASKRRMPSARGCSRSSASGGSSASPLLPDRAGAALPARSDECDRLARGRAPRLAEPVLSGRCRNT